MRAGQRTPARKPRTKRARKRSVRFRVETPVVIPPKRAKRKRVPKTDPKTPVVSPAGGKEKSTVAKPKSMASEHEIAALWLDMIHTGGGLVQHPPRAPIAAGAQQWSEIPMLVDRFSPPRRFCPGKLQPRRIGLCVCGDVLLWVGLVLSRCTLS